MATSWNPLTVALAVGLSAVALAVAGWSQVEVVALLRELAALVREALGAAESYVG